MAVPRPRGIGARLLESDCDPLLLLGESGTGRDESVASYAVGAEPCGNWLMWSGLLSRRGGEAPPGWLPGGASSLLPGGMVVAAARVVVDGVPLPFLIPFRPAATASVSRAGVASRGPYASSKVLKPPA